MNRQGPRDNCGGQRQRHKEIGNSRKRNKAIERLRWYADREADSDDLPLAASDGVDDVAIEGP